MSVGQGYCFAQVADTHLRAEAFGEAQDEQHLFCRQQEGLGRWTGGDESKGILGVTRISGEPGKLHKAEV